MKFRVFMEKVYDVEIDAKNSKEAWEKLIYGKVGSFEIDERDRIDSTLIKCEEIT